MLGLPLLLFWIVACVLLTSVVLAVIGMLDRRGGVARRSGSPGDLERDNPFGA